MRILGETFYCPNCGASVTEESEIAYDALGERTCKHCNRVIPRDWDRIMSEIRSITRVMVTQAGLKTHLRKFRESTNYEIQERFRELKTSRAWPKLRLFRDKMVTSAFVIFVTSCTVVIWGALVLDGLFTIERAVAALVMLTLFWGIIFKAIDYAL